MKLEKIMRVLSLVDYEISIGGGYIIIAFIFWILGITFIIEHLF